METWNALAKCLHDPRVDTDFFFPSWDSWGTALMPTPQTVRMIARYCSDCPVRRECEREAAVNKLTDGFWGGKPAAKCLP